MANDLLLCNKAFKEMRKKWGEKEEEKAAGGHLTKRIPPKLPASSPQVSEGAQSGGKKGSSSPKNVGRVGERPLQSGNALHYHWGPFFISSAIQITI